MWRRQEERLPALVGKSTLFAVLDALARTRGLSFAEFARVAGIEARNVVGFVAEACRATNVDGHEVLRVDRPGMRVELNLPLLEQVFGLTRI